MIEDPRLITGVVKLDNRGILNAFEIESSLSTPVKRVFFVSQAEKMVKRGEHAHRTCEQLIISAIGTFNVQVINKNSVFNFVLSGPENGLYIPKMNWVEFENQDANSVLMVCASHAYDPADYIDNLSDLINE